MTVNIVMKELKNIVDAVGVWFYSQSTNRYLYLLRNDSKHNECWGLPGGKVESGETLMATITRECIEEMGSMPNYIKIVPLEKFTSSDNKFCYNTFFCIVVDEFKPVLNEEHFGYAWIDSGTNPRPMHPGLWSTVNFDAIRNKIFTIQQQFIHHNN